MQFVEYDYVTLLQRVDPWPGESEHFLRSVRLLVHIEFRGRSFDGLMFQENINSLTPGEFLGDPLLQHGRHVTRKHV